MKTRFLILILLIISITIPVSSFAESSIKTKENFQKGTIEWINRCNLIDSAITVMVRDDDMNTDSEKIEQFDVKVWSDFDVESDFENRVIDYTVTETGTNTGIFVSEVFLTTTDDSPGKRIRVVDASVVFAKYVDHTLPNADSNDVTDTLVISGWSVLERNDDGKISRISYDPCVVEHFDKSKDWFDMLDVFYPAPLKQLGSGLYSFEVKCKDHLELIFKYSDSSPICVSSETATKLTARLGWMNDLNAFVYPKIELFESEIIPSDLQRVLDSCNSTGIQPSIGYRYSNDTHIITNNSCEWQTTEDYGIENEN